ncbi:hypothetical protein SARC_08232 [Sphaeroforma arctica JP610]|uniref:Superoxide dismutase copper/zinc binding domain-containing protein n=1 Tax=Sphaeroforma arctica JP610 TaxID=667725 RepID=A0A0L0FTX0_9EUKA|nr:hypothetical protein SARC_08232 [Sphaeroforma arctica JP610]KNC79368.1 hypothetical protein SARC_08232 [Sphaeroforma arctica JP610]|eukprot:XP_014153270.1 hypothetical protein SARC_08232 [Sphaeroforma arctica JP610]
MRYNNVLQTVVAAGTVVCAVVSGCGDAGDDCLEEVNLFLDNSAAQGFTAFLYTDTDVQWVVQMKILDIYSGVYDDCTTEDGQFIDLNWHVHVGASDNAQGVGAECAADAGSPPVGGHYDPTFACSAVTGELEACAALGRTVDNDYMYMCSPESYETDPYSCEVGDYSGKFGQLRFEVDAETESAEVDASGSDRYGPNLELINGRSVVFHCGSPRVVCGNLAPANDNDE